MDRKLMKIFHFSLLWRCNEKCVFCAKGPAPEGARQQFPLREVIARLGEARKEGCEALSLDGGEPTLRPDLPKILKAAIELGYRKITVMTNAVVLSDPAKVAALAKSHSRAAELVSFCVSLHSHRAPVAEKLTRSKNTFKRTLAGLANLRKAGFETDLYHVINAWNYRELPDFAKFAAGPGKARKVILSFIYPARHILRKMYLYPKHSDVRPYLGKALKVLAKAGVPVSLSNCSVLPFCLMKGVEKLYLSAYEDSLNAVASDTSKTEKVPFFFSSFDSVNRVKYPQCSACALDRCCGGMWKFYSIIHGAGEVKPYKGPFLKKFLLKLPAGSGPK